VRDKATLLGTDSSNFMIVERQEGLGVATRARRLETLKTAWIKCSVRGGLKTN
jgi:hypothetical protein